MVEEEKDENPFEFEGTVSPSRIPARRNKESPYSQLPQNTTTDELINSSVDDANSESSSKDIDESPRAGPGSTIEMVDLKNSKKSTNFIMKEFEVAGKVNQSQKKREKRK